MEPTNPWVQAKEQAGGKGWVERMEPFILVGPEGSGKNMLLKHCFSNAGKSTAVTTLHCNSQTTALHVIQKIQYSCAL